MKRCRKCGKIMMVQFSSPFITNYVCKKCNTAEHEIKDAYYPFKAMNKRKARNYA